MHILVVEDEPRLRAALERGLTAEGFNVDAVADGLTGLDHARHRDYDVILLDINLPGMNGYKICEALRADEDWTPILMLTAKDGEWDEVEALDTGADDYVTKPFSFDVLMARIRSLVRRGRPARPVAMTVGDLTLDPGSRQVHRGDTEVNLTVREFALLDYLMRNAGQVVTKRQIMDNVWDHDLESDENLVEVYVGRLRRKLDKPFGTDSIQTVRGTGYRLSQR